MQSSKAMIMQPVEGQVFHAFGQTIHLMLNGEQTKGSITIMSGITPPGGGPPFHVHSREDEIFIVSKGRIQYFSDGNWTEVGVGGVVYLPRGVPHCFKNIGTTDSCHWIINIPSGFEKFFSKCAEEFSKEGGPLMDRIVEIHNEFGITLLEYPK